MKTKRPDDKIPVIFRKDKDNHVIAIFPTLPGDYSMATCMCYEHVGQHSICDITWMQNTTLASPDEYKDLLSELVSLGYDNLKVYMRMTHKFFNARRQYLWGNK